MKNINWYIVEMVERNFLLEWHKPVKSLLKLRLKRESSHEHFSVYEKLELDKPLHPFLAAQMQHNKNCT